MESDPWSLNVPDPTNPDPGNLNVSDPGFKHCSCYKGLRGKMLLGWWAGEEPGEYY